MIGLNNELNRDIDIIIPSIILEDLNDKSSIKFIFDKLSLCINDFQENFGMVPDEMTFCGKVGEQLFQKFSEMFATVYKCKLKRASGDGIILSNSNKKSQMQKEERGVKSMSSFDGLMIEGFHVPSVDSYLTFSYEIEKEKEIIKEYTITVL